MSSAWRGQSRIQSPWKELIAPLRQEAHGGAVVSYSSLCGVLEALSYQHAGSSDLRESEVSEDLAFLAQQLLSSRGAQQAFPGGAVVPRDGQGEVFLCRLLCGLVSSRPLRLHGSAANITLAALRRWGDGGSGSSDSGGAAPGSCVSGEYLQHEALQALGAMVTDNLAQVSAHERAAILALLLALAQPQTVPDQNRPELLETQRLALAALGNCCSLSNGAVSSKASAAAAAAAGGTALSADESMSLLRCALAVLQGGCAAGRVVETAAHARFYGTLLRTLNALVVETKRAWTPHVVELLECLRRFFVYGLHTPSTSSASAGGKDGWDGWDVQARQLASLHASSSGSNGAAAGSGGAGRGSYKPPHLRTPRRSNQDGCSDSDASESDGGSGPSALPSSTADRWHSSKVRIAALTCVQSMTKSDPRAVHPFWSSVLPLQQPLLPRPLTPSILTILLFDLVPRVRGMAAATIAGMVEGPAQRSFLAVAEAKALMPVRGFTTLSTTLGQLVLSLHAGLMHAVAQEPSSVVLAVVLRALCVLLSAAPYDRLPSELLPDVVRAVRARWSLMTSASCLGSPVSGSGGGGAGSPQRAHAVLAVHPAEVVALQSVYLACLAEALSTRKPSEGLRTYLDSTLGAAAQQRQAAGLEPADALIQELLAAARDRQAVVCIEALAALQGLSVHYPAMLPDVWPAILDLVHHNLYRTQEPAASPRGSEAAASGWQRSEAAPASSPQAPSASPGRGPSLSRSSSASGTSGGRGGAGGTVSGTLGTGTLPAGSSPEDKAAQHAVKLVGDYLTGVAACQGIVAAAAISGDDPPPPPPRCTVATSPAQGSEPGVAGSARTAGEGEAAAEAGDEPRAAAAARIALLWRDALGVLAPAASRHTVFMVRSAALGALGQVPEPAFELLDRADQARLVALLTGAVRGEGAASARSAASKVLGALALFDSVQRDGALLAPSAAAVAVAAQGDGVVAVRIASSWALANVCDGLRKHAFAVTAGAAAAAAAAASAGPPPSDSCVAALYELHRAVAGPLCLAAVQVVQDGDKVRTNGVRAIGNLLCFLHPAHHGAMVREPAAVIAAAALSPHTTQAGAAGGGSDSGAGAAVLSAGDAAAAACPPEVDLSAWLSTALTCLQSCLTTGNMKVQWNACYALLGLFANAPLLRSPAVAPRVTQLLLLLVMLVRDSANFKIRIHAAAALAALPGRDDLGDVFPDALLVVAAALEALDTAGGGAAPVASASSATGGASAAAAGASTGSGGPAGATDGGGGAGDGTDEEGRFPNFRYIVSLSLQLRATLLQLLQWLRPADARRLREPLAKRADFLRRTVAAAAADAQRAHLAQVWRAGGGAGDELLLPADPFEASSSPEAAPAGVAAEGGLPSPTGGVRGAGGADAFVSGTSGGRGLSGAAAATPVGLLQPSIQALRGVQQVLEGADQHRQALTDVTWLLRKLQMGVVG